MLCSFRVPQLMVGHRASCVLILPHSAPLAACHAPPTLPLEGPGTSLAVRPSLLCGMERSKGGSQEQPGSPSSGVEAAAGPPSWLSSPSQPVLYLDIDNPNSSPNQPVMDSTGSTLFIYPLSQLQSSVSLPLCLQPPALGRRLSFVRAGQCSSATSSSVAAHPLPDTSRQMRCFKPDEMGDLVLFSPNGAALRRTNTSVLHPPFWPHGRGAPCCGRLHEQWEGTDLFVFMPACTCRSVHMCGLSYPCVFSKNLATFFSFHPPAHESLHIPQGVNLQV